MPHRLPKWAQVPLPRHLTSEEWQGRRSVWHLEAALHHLAELAH